MDGWKMKFPFGKSAYILEFVLLVSFISFYHGQCMGFIFITIFRHHLGEDTFASLFPSIFLTSF